MACFERIKGTIENFYKTSVMERALLAVFAGLTFALVGPFYTKSDMGANFLDSFMAGFVYLFWMTVLLPVLYRKLTMKLVWDVAVIIVILLCGDIMYFGFYAHLKKTLLSANVNAETQDYKRWVFFFGVVRVCVIIVALVRSSSGFLNSSFKSPKKSAKSPRKSSRLQKKHF